MATWWPSRSPRILPDGAADRAAAGLKELLTQRGVRPVSFADWLRIEAAEVAAAPAGAPRRKLIRIKDMLAIVAQPAGRVHEIVTWRVRFIRDRTFLGR